MNLSLLGAFSAGVLTFLSPCVLPLAPILLASLLTIPNPTRFDRFRATLWFSAGFSCIFVLLGLSLPALASTLGAAKPLLLAAAGAVLVLFGLRMMGAFSEGKMSSWLLRSFHLPNVVSRLPKGLHALGFGALFGLSWTPCVGPVLGGVLTFVASQESTPTQGALLLGAFSMGISVPLLALAIGSDYLTPLYSKLKKHLPRIEYVVGLGLFVFGAYVFSQARLQDFSIRSLSNKSVSAIDHLQRTILVDKGKQNSSRMLFFYSETCPICAQMEEYLPELETSCVSPYFELIRINVDLPENTGIAAHFGVRAVPTVSVINEQGAEIVRLVGYQTQGRLRNAARTVTEMTCSKVLDTDSIQPSAKDSCSVGVRC